MQHGLQRINNHLIFLSGNETIDYETFLSFVEEKANESLPNDELREALRVFDRDDNGYISADELRRMMMTSGECLTEEEVDEMMKMADKEGNGRVNYDGNKQQKSNSHTQFVIYIHTLPNVFFIKRDPQDIETGPVFPLYGTCNPVPRNHLPLVVADESNTKLARWDTNGCLIFWRMS